MSTLPRAEWPGTYGPFPATPPRARGSARRTTTIDMLRPDGPDGLLHLRGRGRDLRTDDEGRATVVDAASLDATIDYAQARKVLSLRSTPREPALDELVGRRASSGFRKALDDLVPHRRGSVLYLVLDDVPVTSLISGNVLSLAGTRVDALGLNNTPPADVCAGWRAGGVMAMAVAETGRALNVLGPYAPPLADRVDPDSWHELEPLAPGSMRRARRIDVRPDDDRPDALVVDSCFRDLLVEEDSRESVVHEYTVTATFDRARHALTAIEALPRVLPGPECPLAASSATRVLGRSLDDIRAFVRDELTGTTTCTHLNDALRALGDLDALVRIVDGAH